MSLRILLIAAAALICHCVADVVHINQAAPKDVLVPFNDLLPPPLEESTTEAAAPATKPTKKSFHQQQQQQQQQQARSKVPDISAEKPAVLQLAVDLLPPFVDADSGSSSSTTTTTTTTRQPLVSIKAASTIAPHVAQSVQQHARVAARPNSLASETSASSRFSAELIRQYATYFQSTTPRPPRGPLPTLTPFPRFIKN
ncbi:PREDICTED: tyrosine-protein phosphatase 99A isoform X1 [Drosophila arizonae]|uniref:Tyrosine-protein phosphatase 99A isoform X1 n=1 Tax=Drosophila arizonae TaxID=7263 RepID=A0ABM1NNR5_DROAR|nr:PREDICTED: tyrosine-protein phosphatase 99A isoform X1 [Drosophila arizonae]